MRRSTERILTTHTGSLPRPAAVVAALIANLDNPRDGGPALAAAVDQAVADVVRQQVACGLDIINDGEQGRTDYTVQVKDRLTGFEGSSAPPRGTGDEEFPELALLLKQFASPFQNRPSCSGPIAWKDFAALEADLARAKIAAAAAPGVEFFITSPSPGQIARYLKNGYFGDDRAYIGALAQAMAREYRAITDAGFILQLDCPDLAMLRSGELKHLSLPDYRREIDMHIEALNEATKDIAPERMRMHVCWGSTVAPHHDDVPMIDIVDIVLKGRPAAISFPAANPRHAHEWKIWKDVTLPAGKVLIPGVIDSTTNFVEHPEVVADRIIQFADGVGRENVIAGVDCGFGTFAGRVQVDTKIVWMKLAALAEGARLASSRLW